MQSHLAVREPVLTAKDVNRLRLPHDPQRRLGIEYYVQRARGGIRSRGGILVVLDSDDECIQRERDGRPSLGPELLQRALAVVDVPVAVVVADRNFEAWILADFHSLRARGHLGGRPYLQGEAWRTPEAVKGTAEKLRETIGQYTKSVDQGRLTALLSLKKGMGQRAKSYQWFHTEMWRLTRHAIRTRRSP